MKQSIRKKKIVQKSNNTYEIFFVSHMKNTDSISDYEIEDFEVKFKGIDNVIREKPNVRTYIKVKNPLKLKELKLIEHKFTSFSAGFSGPVMSEFFHDEAPQGSFQKVSLIFVIKWE